MKQRVPDAVVRRLPTYYRHLRDLEHAGVVRISSRELGERTGLTASQIRQDINYFGGFGQQGYGYNVGELKKNMGDILGLTQMHNMVIIGSGNIGQAVANYPSFYNEGFRVSAMFDVDPQHIGKTVRDVVIQSSTLLEAYLTQNRVDIGVIATPAHAAQSIVDQLIAHGVRAIWNFAPTDLNCPEHVKVNNVHLSDSLLVLSYRMKECAQSSQ